MAEGCQYRPAVAATPARSHRRTPPPRSARSSARMATTAQSPTNALQLAVPPEEDGPGCEGEQGGRGQAHNWRKSGATEQVEAGDEPEAAERHVQAEGELRLGANEAKQRRREQRQARRAEAGPGEQALVAVGDERLDRGQIRDFGRRDVRLELSRTREPDDRRPDKQQGKQRALARRTPRRRPSRQRNGSRQSRAPRLSSSIRRTRNRRRPRATPARGY